MIKISKDSDLAEFFARAMGQKDQKPNIDLARYLSKNGSKIQVEQLLNYCICGTKAQKSDAIKVVYELAQLQPDLFVSHTQTLINMLEKADNRMIWGILQALNALSEKTPKILLTNLDQILAATDRSSVIAKDNMMAILTKLSANKQFAKFLAPVILQRLEHSAPNQFPTYAEMAAEIIDSKNKNSFIKIIKQRQKSIASPAKQKRIEKILTRLKPDS